MTHIDKYFLDLFRLDNNATDLMKVSRAKVYNELDSIETEILESIHQNIHKFIEDRSGRFLK